VLVVKVTFGTANGIAYERSRHQLLFGGHNTPLPDSTSIAATIHVDPMFEDPALFSADTARAIVMAAQEVKQGLLILLQGLPWNGSLPGGVHGREAELWKHIELHGATLIKKNPTNGPQRTGNRSKA